MRGLRSTERGYSPKELDRLCNACKTHHRALGFSFITKLLTVHDPAERNCAQRQVFKERLSLIALELRLTARYGHRRQAGKRPKISSADDLLADLSIKTIWWRRLNETLTVEPVDQSGDESLTVEDIPEDIRGPFDKAVKAIGRLETAVKRHLNELRGEPEETGAPAGNIVAVRCVEAVVASSPGREPRGGGRLGRQRGP